MDRSKTFVLTWVFALAGCGGPSGGTSTGPLPREQLLTQFAAVICDSLRPCCQADGFAYDSASCRKMAEASLLERSNLLRRTVAKYDPIAARQCLDAYVSALPACSTNTDWGALPLDDTYEEPPVVASACRGVFTGTLPADADCVSDKECLQPAEGFAACSLGQTATCSVYSTPAPRAKAGEACASDCNVGGGGICYGSAASGTNAVTADCYDEDGLYCTYDPASGTSVCAPLAGIGEPCTSRGCASGAFCPQTGELCAPLPAVGESCASTGFCVQGAYCVAGTCVTPSDSGPCGVAGNELTIDPGACSSGSYCDVTTARCTPKQPDGTPCPQSNACLNDCIGGSGKGSACGKQTFPSQASCTGNLE